MTWIKLSDQKPKDNQRCIVCVRDQFFNVRDGRTRHTKYSVRTARYSAGERSWISSDGHSLCIVVTDWMPFPRVPHSRLNESTQLDTEYGL
jgi:hypothetical protein